jgi:hypothetical protein
MKSILFCLLFFFSITVKAQQPIHQLRIYEIYENNKSAFHERFRDEAMRIMKKYNFNIISIWESKYNERTEFVYLLQWPDENTMKNAWEQFKNDPEWIEIKKKSNEKNGQLVGEIEDRTLTLTDYSPQKNFLGKKK